MPITFPSINALSLIRWNCSLPHVGSKCSDEYETVKVHQNQTGPSSKSIQIYPRESEKWMFTEKEMERRTNTKP